MTDEEFLKQQHDLTANALKASRREQTAATILAALIGQIDGLPTAGAIREATGLAVVAADALRVEQEQKP